MSVAKNILLVSVIVVFVAVYVHRTVDRDLQIEYGLMVTVRLSDWLFTLDAWLHHFNVKGLRRPIEDVLSNYKYGHINTSGLIVGMRRFDGVDVIIFDVLHHERRRPAIVFVHGGGWTTLNARFYGSLTADLARRLGTMVVSVDYRKSPENPFPAAFNDVLAAVKYLFANAVTFDVDPGRVALMGDSAGGNLAVAVAYHLSATRRGHKAGHSAKLVVPLCPSLQTADMQMPSFRDNVNDIVLTKRQLARHICTYAFGWMSASDLSDCAETMAANGHLDEETATLVRDNMDWTSHLKGKGYDNRPKSTFFQKSKNRFSKRLSQLAKDPRFSPLSALNDTQLRLLPPTYAFGASRDPLRDDARLLVARLSAIGNLAHYRETDFYHDPFILSQMGLSRALVALEDLEAVFKQNAIL